MPYASLRACIDDLERHGHLVRVKEEVDPDLEMAAIHRRVFEAGGPAVLYENIKGCSFKAVSNLFGDAERSRFIFRHTLDKVKRLIALRADPAQALKSPLSSLRLSLFARNALPRRVRNGPALYAETSVGQLPQIRSWPGDGGPFVLLPQVFTEDLERPGVMASNLGCYRIQLGGNDYVAGKEVGLHYQIHRGIGVHQAKANARGLPMKVSIFVGGPPAHTFAAVMPLPEGISELTFAGALGGRRFRYLRKDGSVISADADFVITGEVHPGSNKAEGPFGDHLGYYSLRHDFPVMKVHKVWHRKDAIWPFTVVGRPPQEDTAFGTLIHEITGPVVPREIPGLRAVHAVDAAGVHPLLLALGSERYTPYSALRRPQEILTIASAILGFSQMSLAKYLFIAAGEDNPSLGVHDVAAFFRHVLERIRWERDVHFHTNTTMDTLDYSGTGLNSGSKAVLAAAGEKIRELAQAAPADLKLPDGFGDAQMPLPGVLVLKAPAYANAAGVEREIQQLEQALQGVDTTGLPLIVLADDSAFTAASLRNFLWVTFTRSNPSHDIHGIGAFTENKHWGCRGPLLIDARIKPHHAPPLMEDPAVERKVDRLFERGGVLSGATKVTNFPP